MENLERNISKCSNMPGFKKIWAATTDEVHIIEPVTSTLRTVSFKDGAGYGLIDAKKISLSNVYTDGVYSLDINCEFWGIPDMVEERLRCMAAARYIVRVQDRNGVMWLAGSTETPLRFDFTRTEDSDAFGAKKYDFRFFNNSNYPLYTTF